MCLDAMLSILKEDKREKVFLANILVERARVQRGLPDQRCVCVCVCVCVPVRSGHNLCAHSPNVDVHTVCINALSCTCVHTAYTSCLH